MIRTWQGTLIILVICILSVCQTAPKQEFSFQTENEITKDVRLFTNQLATRIYRISPEEARVLVMDFTDLGKKFTYLGTYISDKLSEELSQTENITLVNRADIELIMDELSFQRSGMVTEADTIKIGEFSGANILITGTITDLGNEIDVSAEITHLTTSEAVPVSYRMMKTKENMALIGAITAVEREKEQELGKLIQRLEEEIERRKTELEYLVTQGAEEIAEKLRREEESKRQELVRIEQELREKSTLLAKLKEIEKEVA
jgi:TolB-like protein